MLQSMSPALPQLSPGSGPLQVLGPSSENRTELTPTLSLPSHLLGRWTQSSSPSFFAAPTDEITQKTDKKPAKFISPAQSDSLSAYTSGFVVKKPTEDRYFSVSSSCSGSSQLQNPNVITSALGATHAELPANQRGSSGSGWTNERQRRAWKIVKYKRSHSDLILGHNQTGSGLLIYFPLFWLNVWNSYNNNNNDDNKNNKKKKHNNKGVRDGKVACFSFVYIYIFYNNIIRFKKKGKRGTTFVVLLHPGLYIFLSKPQEINWKIKILFGPQREKQVIVWLNTSEAAWIWEMNQLNIVMSLFVFKIRQRLLFS